MPKKKENWVSKLKKGVKSVLKGRHSIAGKRYLKEGKKGTTVKQLYERIKRNSPELSDSDAMWIAKDEISNAHEKKIKERTKIGKTVLAYEKRIKAAKSEKEKRTIGRITRGKGFRQGRK